jgi:chorismate mutase/prephenate dehydratase
MENSIQQWRGLIDAIDKELLELLNQRALLALAVGRRKRAAKLHLRDPKREQAILSRARERNAGPLSAAAIARLFRAILAESRRVQSRTHGEPQSSRRGSRG